MTTPMMPSTAPVRPAAPGRSEGRDGRESDSAAPFATALDGAMSESGTASRIPPRDAGGRGRDTADNPGRHLGRGHEDATPEGPRVPDAPRRHGASDPAEATSGSTDGAAPTDAPPPAGVPAALWALLLAAATSASPVAPAQAPSADGAAATGPTATPPLAGLPAATTVDVVPGAPFPGTPAAFPTVPALPSAVPDAPLAPSLQVPVAAPAAPSAAAPSPAAPDAQPAPVAPAGATGPADPAASFATLVATSGAAVTEVTTAAPQTVVPPRTATAPEPAAAVPDSGVPAAVPLDAGAGGPSAAPVTGGQSAGNGNPGQDGGSSDPSRDEVPALIGPAPASPASPVAAVAATEAAPAPAPAPPVSGQIARHVAVLRGLDDGEHSMTLVLTPERLGPVEIQVTVSKGSLDLNLRGAHEQGRAALLEALPDLRRDLQSAGLTCSRLEVDRTTGGAFTVATTSSSSSTSGGLGQSASQMSQQQTPGQRGGRPDWSDGRFPSGLRTADSGDNHSVPSSTRSTSAGVDVRV